MKDSIEKRPVDITLDPGQKEVAEINDGRHVVCGGPGSGKTFLLAFRLWMALTVKGIAPEAIACFTLARKAASSMRKAIAKVLPPEKTKDIYVGSMHGKCRQILYQNGIIADNTGVVDEEDAVEIVKGIGMDEHIDMSEDTDFKDAIDVTHWIHAFRNGYSNNLIGRRKSFKGTEIKNILAASRLECNRQNIIHLFDNVERYVNSVRYPQYLQNTLNMLRLAKKWEAYKRENHLIDFEDMLMLSYDYLRSSDCPITKLQWVQVDEAQDLTDLMHEIINVMTTPDAFIIYYADEQQAISSFMGSKLETLRALIQKNFGKVHQLVRNHRSCPSIVRAVNAFASQRLGVDHRFLQQPAANIEDNDPQILEFQDKAGECSAIVAAANALPQNERLAIIVPNRYDGDDVATALRASGINALQMAGQDAFRSKAFRFLCAHLATLRQDNDFLSWSLILEELHLQFLPDGGACRRFLMDLRRHMLSPSDLLLGPNSYLDLSARAVQDEYVIFDTETTGLSTSEDEIVQLAAVKYRNGIPVDEFEVILHKNKDLPAIVGGKVNPLIKRYEEGPVVPRKEGFENFLQFIGNAPLVAHNLDFDYHILESNLRRDCGITDFIERHPFGIDTLHIARLTLPTQFSYKLESLIASLHLAGENSHLATDDVRATGELLNYCIQLYYRQAEAQTAFLQQISGIAAEFYNRYGQFYLNGRTALFARPDGSSPAIISYFRYIHAAFVSAGYISPVDKFEQIMAHIEGAIVDPATGPLLADQVSAYLFDISTSKEADLCESPAIHENVIIATPFRIKGQQFDQVWVLHANDGTYPYYANKEDHDKDDEDARKFYVAISRAIKKLIISYRKRNTFTNWRGETFDKDAIPSPFIRFLKG